MNLQNWINQAEAHWKEYLPSKYASLKKAGKLTQALQSAAEMTHKEMSQLEEAGFQNHEAWEMTREKYLFLPGEPESEETGQSLHQQAVALTNEILRKL